MIKIIKENYKLIEHFKAKFPNALIVEWNSDSIENVLKYDEVIFLNFDKWQLKLIKPYFQNNLIENPNWIIFYLNWTETMEFLETLNFELIIQEKNKNFEKELRDLSLDNLQFIIKKYETLDETTKVRLLFTMSEMLCTNDDKNNFLLFLINNETIETIFILFLTLKIKNC